MTGNVNPCFSKRIGLVIKFMLDICSTILENSNILFFHPPNSEKQYVPSSFGGYI